MMEETFLRFDHLPEQMFKQLDDKSLVNSRVVAISWREFVDDREYPLKRFMKVISELNEECRNGHTPFHLACEKGQTGVAEIIIRSSAKVNIDLNPKDNFGETAFHMACSFGPSKTAELLIKHSAEFNIDLNAKNNFGYTAFYRTCINGRSKIVGMIMKNSVEIWPAFGAKQALLR